MSLKNEAFESAVKEIVNEKTLEAAAKRRASERIKEICETTNEEHGFEAKELKAYANKVFLKLENRPKYNEEAELVTRIYEEVDEYEV